MWLKHKCTQTIFISTTCWLPPPTPTSTSTSSDGRHSGRRRRQTTASSARRFASRTNVISDSSSPPTFLQILWRSSYPIAGPHRIWTLGCKYNALAITPPFAFRSNKVKELCVIKLLNPPRVGRKYLWKSPDECHFNVVVKMSPSVVERFRRFYQQIGNILSPNGEWRRDATHRGLKLK